MHSETAPILVDGAWTASKGGTSLQAVNPRTTKPLPVRYPVSSRADVEKVLTAAAACFAAMRIVTPEARATFLERYADGIEARREELAAKAEEETGLDLKGRLLG